MKILTNKLAENWFTTIGYVNEKPVTYIRYKITRPKEIYVEHNETVLRERGKGYASELLRALRKEYPIVKGNWRNDKAKKFWEKQGAKFRSRSFEME